MIGDEGREIPESATLRLGKLTVRGPPPLALQTSPPEPQKKQTHTEEQKQSIANKQRTKKYFPSRTFKIRFQDAELWPKTSWGWVCHWYGKRRKTKPPEETGGGGRLFSDVCGFSWMKKIIGNVWEMRW